jgi:hypothetical protein
LKRSKHRSRGAARPPSHADGRKWQNCRSRERRGGLRVCAYESAQTGVAAANNRSPPSETTAYSITATLTLYMHESNADYSLLGPFVIDTPASTSQPTGR